MHRIPLKQWYRHTESRGLSSLTYYLPQEHRDQLAVLQQYWAGQLTDLRHCRKHKWGGHVRSGHFDAFDGTIFFKRFSITSARYLHKPPRARVSVAQHQRLEEAGFITPSLLGLIEHRVCGVLKDSALVCGELVGFRALHVYLNDGAVRDALTREQRRELVNSLGHVVGRWHTQGFFHGDMHSGNIMCRIMNGAFEFSWLDNEEGRHYARLPQRKRFDDLNHLNRSDYDAPVTDRLRFWRTYTKECGFGMDVSRLLSRKLATSALRYRARKEAD